MSVMLLLPTTSLGGRSSVFGSAAAFASSDLWTDNTYWNTLHPNCKYEQAERCAKIALSVLGKGRQEEGVGPVLVSIEVNGKTAVLTYENVGTGLKTADGGNEVLGFAIINRSYALIQDSGDNIVATITAPNQITITSDRRITGIAYNSVYNYVYGQHVNLCNSFGVPAAATMILYSAD